MRRILLVWLFGLAAYGLWAQDIQPSFGFGLIEEYSGYTAKSGGIEDVGSTSYFGLSAFADFSYFYIGLAWKIQQSDLVVVSTDTNSGTKSRATAPNSSRSFLSLRVLGKIPIILSKTITLFPQAGVQCDLFLSDNDLASMTEAQKASLSDFFIDLGIGVDFNLSSAVYLRIAVDADINLTPSLINGAGNSISGYNCDGTVSVGFKL